MLIYENQFEYHSTHWHVAIHSDVNHGVHGTVAHITGGHDVGLCSMDMISVRVPCVVVDRVNVPGRSCIKHDLPSAGKQ
jgi:hypothetical protein